MFTEAQTKFAGSDNGRAHKRKAPPFQALEAAAGVDSDDTPEEIDRKVAEFCASKTPGGKAAEDTTTETSTSSPQKSKKK